MEDGLNADIVHRLVEIAKSPGTVFEPIEEPASKFDVILVQRMRIALGLPYLEGFSSYLLLGDKALEMMELPHFDSFFDPCTLKEKINEGIIGSLIGVVVLSDVHFPNSQTSWNKLLKEDEVYLVACKGTVTSGEATDFRFCNYVFQ
jgi:hypothetical protein